MNTSKRAHGFARSILVLLFAFLVAACNSVGELDTFNKRMATAYTTVQAVADGAAAAQVAGKLGTADVANVVTTSRAALAALDVANTLHATDAKGADDKLAATMAILIALQTYIATQGAK
jgi:hypothetical protein